MRSGLWAIRDTLRLFVGSGEPDTVKSFAIQWTDSGWTTEVKPNVSARRKLRAPYEPMVCALCSWAGLNLGVHHARKHPDEPAPTGRVTSPVIASMARLSRATQDRNRVPCSGLLIIEALTNEDVLVYRVQRVSGDKVTIKPLTGTPGNLTDRTAFTVGIAEALQRFRPVGRWVRR